MIKYYKINDFDQLEKQFDNAFKDKKLMKFLTKTIDYFSYYNNSVDVYLNLIHNILNNSLKYHDNYLIIENCKHEWLFSQVKDVSLSEKCYADKMVNILYMVENQDKIKTLDFNQIKNLFKLLIKNRTLLGQNTINGITTLAL